MSKWIALTLIIKTLMLKLNVFYLNNELAKFEIELENDDNVPAVEINDFTVSGFWDR